MDGLKLARHLREIAPDINITMVSGYSDLSDSRIQEAISLGVISNFISKPFLHIDILKALKPDVTDCN